MDALAARARRGLTVAAQLEVVAPLPVGAPRRAHELVALVPLLEGEAAALAAGARQAAHLAVLVHAVADPVHLRVAADRRVRRVDEDALVVLVRRVLVDPVRVEHAHVRAALADALLRELCRLRWNLSWLMP